MDSQRGGDLLARLVQISVRIGGGEKDTRAHAHTHMHTRTRTRTRTRTHARTHTCTVSLLGLIGCEAAVDGPGSDARRLGREATRMRDSDGRNSDARRLGRKATRMRDSDGRSSDARRLGCETRTAGARMRGDPGGGAGLGGLDAEPGQGRQPVRRQGRLVHLRAIAADRGE